MSVGKLPAAHRADLGAYCLPVFRLRVGVVPSGPAFRRAKLPRSTFMVRYDCSAALRTERKCHVLNHLSCVIFHLSSPSSHFSPFLQRFLGKISKYIRKAAKWKSAPPRQVGLLLRRPIPARPCSSRNKLKCAKAPCLREVSHTLVHFGEKEWHRNRSSDACTFFCFILRR